MNGKAGFTPHTVAIVQARMGSTRLPGKVLMEIEGRPLLRHVVERLRQSAYIKDVVVATTVDTRDDAIDTYCSKNGISMFRGSGEDVLDRYYRAALAWRADPIVRITADCPLIDPVVADRVVKEYLDFRGSCDGTSNVIERTYPRGLDTEVLSRVALEKCWHEADQGYQREHVTPYIYEHRELFSLLSVKGAADYSRFRWTVDEEADLRFVQEVYKRLYKGGRIFLTDEVISLLKSEPELAAINSAVKQKAAGRWR